MPLISDNNVNKFVKVAADNIWQKNGQELPYPPVGHPPPEKQTDADDRNSIGTTVFSTGLSLQEANTNVKCKSNDASGRVQLEALGTPGRELVDVTAAVNLRCKTRPDVGSDAYTCVASNAVHCTYTRDLDFEKVEGEIEGDPVEWVAKMKVKLLGGQVTQGTVWKPKLTMTFAGSDETEVKLTFEYNKDDDKWDLSYDYTENDGGVGNKIDLQIEPLQEKEIIVHLVANESDAVTMYGTINDAANYKSQGVAVIAMGPAEAEKHLSSLVRGRIIYDGVVMDD